MREASRISSGQGSHRTLAVVVSTVLAFSSALSAAPTASAADNWAQVGDPMNGLSAVAYFGESTDLSADGSIVAIGAPLDRSAGLIRAGSVQVYTWTGDSWEQRGSTLTGGNEDLFGSSVALSASGNALAVGATQQSGPGYTRIYTWDGTDWVAQGSAISGVRDGGFDVAMSGNGEVVVIGDPGATPNGTLSGAVSVYRWNAGTSSWQIQGTPPLSGAQAFDLAGASVAISSSGDVVAFGAPSVDPSHSGYASVYQWDSGNSVWVQRGIDLPGGAPGAKAGVAVALSSDGSVLAVGEDHANSRLGITRTYDWDGASWRVRPALSGSAPGGGFGISVDLSSSGDALVVGASEANAVAGQTSMYTFSGSTWTQRGTTIDGVAAGDQAGSSVAISADGNIVASGYMTSTNSGGSQAGQVRVFAWSTPAGVTSGPATYFTFYLPDGRECTSISPQRVQAGSVVELPGEDALCRTSEGSLVAGWTIPVPPGFTGAGSSSLPFNPGHRVRVIESQRFTVVPFDPVLTVEYDSNIAADDSCTAVGVTHGSDDGRVGYSWVPRSDLSLARTWSAAPCSPAGHELVGWNTAGDGSGDRVGLGENLPAGWEADTRNHHRLYAVWAVD